MPERRNKGLSQEMEPKSIPSHTCATSDCATYQHTAVTDMFESRGWDVAIHGMASTLKGGMWFSVRMPVPN